MRTVTARAEGAQEVVHRLELRLPADIVLHELEEREVPLTGDSLAAFLTSDTKDCSGRDAYLEIARAVSGLSVRKREEGPFRWAWADTIEVTQRDGLIIFIGTTVAL